MNTTEKLASLWESSQNDIITGFFQFLTFESVSAQSQYKEQLHKCVHWLKQYLAERLGFQVEVWETSGHPVIFAERNDAGPGTPTVLVYNHYDVQPVDPLELWDSPPFKPEIRDGMVYARGAQDNKGQSWCVFTGLRLLLEQYGRLPVNVKLCIEGEEEIGSAALSKILEAKRDRLKADYLMIQDCLILGEEQPAVTLGVRGVVKLEVELTSASSDLHSGCHGGIVYNPCRALSEILSSLWDSDGKVAVPGFYEGVELLTEDERRVMNFEFDEAEYLRDFGAVPAAMEKGFSPNEARWTRPTVEINGMWGGHIGEGSKTIIPAKAYAKLSCRIVPGQEPKRVGRLVLDFLKNNCPDGVQIEGEVGEGMGTALRTSPKSKLSQAAASAYSEVWNTPCDFILEGSTIPVAAGLARASGAETAFLGFGLTTDSIHAPNEHFSLERLKKGALTFGRTLEILGAK